MRSVQAVENEIIDYEYIRWLDNYTLDNPEFLSDYMSNTNKNSLDKENVEKLKVFYKMIDEYAKKNYIFSCENTLGYHYNIKFENSFFEIGIVDYGEILYYCKKTKEKAKYIEFENIINNKTAFESELIKLKFTKLTILLSELSLVIPKESIIEQVNKVLKYKN